MSLSCTTPGRQSQSSSHKSLVRSLDAAPGEHRATHASHGGRLALSTNDEAPLLIFWLPLLGDSKRSR